MGNVFPITGEGNGTPLQYSCLENPMDGGAGKVAVHRVAKSRTRLKRPSITAIFGFCDCFLICKSFESEATSPQEPFYPMDLCFFCLFVYICQSIYLFGFTGCQLQHAGFLIFPVTRGVFNCGLQTLNCSMQDLVLHDQKQNWEHRVLATWITGKSQS